MHDPPRGPLLRDLRPDLLERGTRQRKILVLQPLDAVASPAAEDLDHLDAGVERRRLAEVRLIGVTAVTARLDVLGRQDRHLVEPVELPLVLPLPALFLLARLGRVAGRPE